MTTTRACRIARSVLEAFRENSGYDDYQAADRDNLGWTDHGYDEMLSVLGRLAEDDAPRVAVVIEGGVCQEVVADRPIEVAVLDRDDLRQGGVPAGAFTVVVDSAAVGRCLADPTGFAGCGSVE